MHKLHKLTPRQKQYAEEHIMLVYKFLAEKKLPEAEFYDIVIFGYLAAVQEYDERLELLKYPFTTIAWHQMNDCLSVYFTYLNRLKRKAVTVSIQSEGQCFMEELLPDCRKNLLDSVSDRLYALEIMSQLTKKEREIVILKADGMTYKEIAARCGITPNAVNYRFNRMRQRLNLLLSA